MTENIPMMFNCSGSRSDMVEARLGENPGMFCILTAFLALSNMLAWVLHTFINNLPENRVNINVFLNIRVVDTLNIMMYLVVNPFII